MLLTFSDSRLSGYVIPDDILSDTDVRYWMLGAPEIKDLETALLEDKYNTNLWLKLAYKKLYSNHG